MHRLIVLFVAALFLGGCASVGQPFPSDQVETITVGETTRADVRATFGDPWRTGFEDGDPTWTYGNYRWSAFGKARTEDLVIRFGQDGLVRSWTYNTTD